MEPVHHGFSERVYAAVQRIPAGRVATYGDIAAVVGNRRWARRVGWALANLSIERARKVPWQRVINAQGRISLRDDLVRGDTQHALLLEEGIVFSPSGRCDLAEYRCLAEELM